MSSEFNFKKGKLVRDASNRLTYEIEGFWAEQYKPTKKMIAKEFGMIPLGVTIATPDEVFQTFIKGMKRIGIEWDIWSGLIIVAKNKRSEYLVIDIAKFCEANDL